MRSALMDITVRLIRSGGYNIPTNLLTLGNHPGPFRRTSEISLGLLRQNEDALMTVLETFLHDPTTDFIGRKVCSDPSPKPASGTYAD